MVIKDDKPVNIDGIGDCSPLYSQEAEMALIGCLLMDSSILERVDRLRSEHFFEPLHKKIFQIVFDLHRQNMAITREALIKELFSLVSLKDSDEKGKVERHILNCFSASIMAVNPAGVAELIIDYYIKRQIIQMYLLGTHETYEERFSANAPALLERLEKRLVDINMHTYRDSNVVSWDKGFDDVLSEIAEAYKGRGALMGVTTGLFDLDTKLNGFQKSDFIILAGRPGMGKTALALNMAVRAVLKLREEGKACLFFSLEMSAAQLYKRAASTAIGVSTAKLNSGKITQDHYDDIARWLSEVGRGVPLFVKDASNQTMATIRSEARKYARKHNLGIIFIDYLQLIETLDKPRGASRVEEISKITRDLKQLAKELDIPIVALSQLSRNVENREDKRPILADLRESGSIEQDSDIVLFVYREEYYTLRNQPQQGTAEYEAWVEQKNRMGNKAEIIIAKHRNGPLGIVPVYFESATTTFRDMMV